MIEGRLRPSCGLSPEEYFALAVREWEMVLGWTAAGVALQYHRPVTLPGGTLVIDVASEADARALTDSLPLAPYADITLRRVDGGHGSRPAAPPLPVPFGGRPK